MELKNLYGISSIWTTIRTFESIVQDLIDEAVAESEVEVRRDACEGPLGVVKDVDDELMQELTLVPTAEDQARPLGIADQDQQLTNSTDVELNVQSHGIIVPFVGVQYPTLQSTQPISEAMLKGLLNQLEEELQKVVALTKLIGH